MILTTHPLYGLEWVIDQAEPNGLPQAVSMRDGERNLDFAAIVFQHGPVAEVGVNGIGIEHLLDLVIMRLKIHRSGEFACRENAIALTKAEECLLWLHKRTADRLVRGVEGKNEQ